MLNSLKKLLGSPQTAEAKFQNKVNAVQFEKLGLIIPQYQPTYDYGAGFINSFHESFSTCPLEGGVKIITEVPGSLRRADALKIYEMAYFAGGDLLELGCNRGLSTYIASRANHDNGLRKKLLTNDLEERYINETRKNLEAQGVLKNVEFGPGDAVNLCQTLRQAGRKFSFCFIDHSHAYQPVYDVAVQLQDIIEPGGFCLFHDFNDKRNPDPKEDGYGVAQAVLDAFHDSPFRFFGVFGCTALYKRKED